MAATMTILTVRETVEFHLNVLTRFDPVLPDNCRECPVVLIANMPPARQHAHSAAIDRPAICHARYGR